MLIKRAAPEALWIVCAICDTGIRPKTGQCKCGNIKVSGNAEKGELVEIESEDSDATVYDND